MTEPTTPATPSQPMAPEARPVFAYGRMLSILAVIVLGIIALVSASYLSSFITPVFLGLNLVLAIAPLMHWLIRKGMHRVPAAIIALITIYSLLLLFVWALVWSVTMLVQELPKYGPEFTALYRSVLDWLASLGISQDELLSQVSGALSPSAIAGFAQSLLSNIGGVMSLLATLLVVIFFLFFDAVTFEPRMRRVRQVRPNVGRAFDTFSAGVGRYWIVTTAFGIIVAILDVIMLEILHVPLALVWGVFSFLTNYIPNIGFVIGMVPPVLMALLANGWVNALVVLVLWSVINFVIQSLIQPKVAGDAVGVTPTVSFLSLLVWAFVLGPVGALLALPATLFVKAILIDADPNNRWLGFILDARPDVGDGDDDGNGIPDAEEARTIGRRGRAKGTS
ncbi:AI-2E family transporter [Gulosibacter macacae]|nr:AI-2E family transporter [Gulosibacter macacae]